jgi:outer membrane cobalamin receptor
VLKGPASTLYGILDPGGLINVVTKRPEKPSAAQFLPPPPALAAAPDRLM